MLTGAADVGASVGTSVGTAVSVGSAVAVTTGELVGGGVLVGGGGTVAATVGVSIICVATGGNVGSSATSSKALAAPWASTVKETAVSTVACKFASGVPVSVTP